MIEDKLKEKKIKDNKLSEPPKPISLNTDTKEKPNVSGGLFNKIFKKKEEKEKSKNTRYKAKSNTWKFFIVPAVVLTFLILIAITLIIFKVNKVIFIVYLVLAIPPVLISIGFSFVMLWRSRKKIKSFVVKKVSTNYMKAIFFGHNKIITEEVTVPNKGGKYFTFNGGIYMIDKEAVFFTTKKESLCFYILGVPNPLKFNFSKYIQAFIKQINKYAINPKGDITFPTDWDGSIIDVSYSSENLQLFKNDKIFKEIHQDLSNKFMGIIYALIGSNVLWFILVILVLVLK